MPTGIYIRTLEIRKILSDAHKRIGVIPPSRKGLSLSTETKNKISMALKGRKGRVLTEKEKEKISQSLIGHKYPESRNLKISKAMKGKRKGDKNPRWKGGVTKQYFLIRNSLKYMEWRRKVFVRDNFICRKCGDNHGRNLNAHHRKSFLKLLKEAARYSPLFPLYEAAMMYEGLWKVENGITLCDDCHKHNQNKKLDEQEWNELPERNK